MLKLLGACCVICAGVWVYLSAAAEERRRLEVLRQLAAALETMSDEIRMNRTPMPRLLKKLAAGHTDDVCAFFVEVYSLCQEMELTDAWRCAAKELSLPEKVRETFGELGSCLVGDEERVCRGMAFLTEQLRQELELRRARLTEVLRRRSAFCFSGAALLIILLI